MFSVVRKVVPRPWSNVNQLHTFCGYTRYTLKLWTAGYQWALENKAVLQKPHSTDSGCVLYFVWSSTLKEPLTEAVLRRYERMKNTWTTFPQFKSQYFTVWAISIKQQHSNQSTFSCPNFQKNDECKHSLGMKIRLRLVQVPREVRNVPIGQKRRYGRPLQSKISFTSAVMRFLLLQFT